MQMIRVSLLCPAVLVSTVLLAAGFGVDQPMGGDDDDEGCKEEDVYPCYHDMHCLLGEEVFQEAAECHDMLRQKDLELYWQWMSEEGVDEVRGKNPKEMSEILCPLDEDKKKEMFDNVAGKMMNYLTEECQNDSQGEECDHGNKLLNCLGDKMDKLKKEGKCGEDVDNSKKDEE